jgi:hypothetical protein
MMRWIKIIHGWMGVLVLPWVIIFGLTGFFLNHQHLLGEWPDADLLQQALPQDAAGRLASQDQVEGWLKSIRPGVEIKSMQQGDLNGSLAWQVEIVGGTITAPVNSSSYFEVTPMQVRLFDAQGDVVRRDINWKRISRELHVHGWLSDAPGTLIADAFSFILVGFGISGLALWGWPRLRRVALKRTRLGG